MVFDDYLVEARFPGVVEERMERTGIDVPLWVSRKDVLMKMAPLGDAWRNTHGAECSSAFNWKSR